MPQQITVDEAIDLLTQEINRQGKFSLPGVLNGILGVAVAKSSELQDALNDLLTKKGVLNPEDQAALEELLKRQAAELKKTKAIRTTNTLAIIGVVAVVGGILYLTFKHKKS
jgi:hypothetical protein